MRTSRGTIPNIRTLHRWANQVFDASYRRDNFCNWCGNKVVKRLVHHGDGIPSNNIPGNLWALCGRSCHAKVHDSLLNGKEVIRSLGGLATAARGGGFKSLATRAKVHSSDEQSRKAKLGIGESKAKGARVANAKRVKCSDCDRVMNPGSLGMHKRVHMGGGSA